jgi:hypothetical protein
MLGICGRMQQRHVQGGEWRPGRCATGQELCRDAAAAAAAGMGITGASVNTWQIPLPHCQGKGNKKQYIIKKNTAFIGICSKSMHLDINLVSL